MITLTGPEAFLILRTLEEVYRQTDVSETEKLGRDVSNCAEILRQKLGAEIEKLMGTESEAEE